MIISYVKFVDPHVTRLLKMPVDSSGATLGIELATLADGTTYVFVPDTATLPTDQPQEIAVSVKTVTLTAAQIAEIKAASPHVRLINQRVGEMIAEKYTQADENKCLRLGLASPEFAAYNTHVEACRAWGAAEKAKLGL